MTYDWLQLRESLHAAKRDLESATNAATTPDGEGKDALKSAALSVDDAIRNVDKAVKNFSTSPLQPRPQLMHSGISPTPVVAVDNSPGQLSSTAKSDNTEGDTAEKGPNMKRNPHKRKKAAILTRQEQQEAINEIQRQLQQASSDHKRKSAWAEISDGDEEERSKA